MSTEVTAVTRTSSENGLTALPAPKRQCLSVPTLYVQPTTIRDASFASKNVVLLCSESYQFLFGSENHTTTRYVQVAGNVYQVAQQQGVASDTIYLSELQEEDCRGQLGTTPSSSLSVEPFDPSSLTSAVHCMNIELSPLHLWPNSPNQLIVNVKQLKCMFRENLTDRVLRQGQSVCLPLSYGTLKATIQHFHLQSVDSGLDLQWNPSRLFGRFDDDTTLAFSVKEKSPIFLIDQIISPQENEKFTFSVTARSVTQKTKKKKLSKDDWGQKDLPLSVGLDNLKIKMLQNRPTHLVKGQTITLPWCELYDLEITLKNAPPSPPSANYGSCFSLANGLTPLFKSSETVRLFDETKPPVIAAKMEFLVLDFCPSSKDTFSGATWVSPEQFLDQIKGLPWADQEKYVVKHPIGKCLIQLEKAVPLDPAAPKKEETVRWSPNEKTQVSFQCRPGIGLFLVADTPPIPLPEIALKIELVPLKTTLAKLFSSLPISESVTIEEKELQRLVRKKFPEEIAPGMVFIIPYDEKDNFKITVDSFKDVQPIVPGLGVLGALSDETKLLFTNLSPRCLSIIRENPLLSQKIDLDRLNEVLFEHGLGGLSEQFHTIIRTILLTRTMKGPSAQRGLKPVRGLLLYGPPGTGKTTLARNLGKFLGCEGDKLSHHCGSEFWNKYIGESEKNIRELFARARRDAQLHGDRSELHVIIIDELDALLPDREAPGSDHLRGAINQFLSEMDGLGQLNNILVVGLTNQRKLIDPAALRPGRFDIHVKIDLPSEEGRRKILEIHTDQMRKNNLLAPDVNLTYLAQNTKGFSGADLVAIVSDANSYSMMRLFKLKVSEEELTKHPDGILTMQDFQKALKQFKENRVKPNPNIYS
ncbi:MAG: ATP-binding protein [Verrucomicrobiota bacterium]|nr:ATP-binding protein [Verrucomicrobiota bacterium]